MGYAVVNALLAGERACVAVERRGEVVVVPLAECLGKKNFVDPNILLILKTLSV